MSASLCLDLNCKLLLKRQDPIPFTPTACAQLTIKKAHSTGRVSCIDLLHVCTLAQECHTCQARRLAIAQAIKRNAPPDEIAALKRAYVEHLQWMLKQRRRLEQITQMAGHENMIVENSDKCGDSCFYLPNSSRTSSANQSKYKYRLSLQANVYAGKLFHLMLLLPNLTTGADFGITSFLSGASCACFSSVRSRPASTSSCVVSTAAARM